MTLPSEAAFLACQDIDSIIYLMYANRLHVRHIDKKGLFVCLASLCNQNFTEDPEEFVPEDEIELIELDSIDTNHDLIFKE